MSKIGRIAVWFAALPVVALVAMALLRGPAPEQAARIDALRTAGPGPLDGHRFTGMLGPDGQPKDVRDTFVFENGTFVSQECETRCDYPARPYSATRTDTGWQFESVTRCPGKDATIVWRGTVRDDRITGVATWTMRRWYWTIERDFAFEATRQSTSAASAILR